METIHTQLGPDGNVIRFVKVEAAGKRPCIFYYSREDSYKTITTIVNRDGLNPEDVDFVDIGFQWPGIVAYHVEWKSGEIHGSYPKIRGYAEVPEEVKAEFMQLAADLNLSGAAT